MPDEELSAIPLDGVQAVVALHNVAGASGVLNAAGDELEANLVSHYTYRGIDHIPHTGDLPIQKFLLTPQIDNMQDHLAYREKLANTTFIPISSTSELANRGIQRAVFLPYIRLTDEPLEPSIEWVRYGLPPSITVKLKDKAYIHRWLVRHGFAIHVPNHVACDAGYIPRFGKRMLRKIVTMYEALEMRDRYPVGLMIRGALSDGNYAMAAIIEAMHDMVVGNVTIRKGQWMLKPNGKAKDLEVFDTAGEALVRVREHIRGENDPDIDDRVVMSRLLDLETSPGLCVAVANNAVFEFPFNGQYMEPGDTACTGTTTFLAALGVERADYYTHGYLTQSQGLLRNILDIFFEQHRVDNLYAMLNMDVMIVGDLERELYQRAIAMPEVGAVYLSSFGKTDDDYEPRIYNPAQVLFAEVNPRDTNWTIAMKAVLQAMQLPCTVQNLAWVSNGDNVQILARDHWLLPAGLSVDTARDLLLNFHQQVLQPNGEGFIVRMSDNPMGVIVYTRSKNPLRLTEITREAFDYLKTHMPVLA